MKKYIIFSIVITLIVIISLSLLWGKKYVIGEYFRRRRHRRSRRHRRPYNYPYRNLLYSPIYYPAPAYYPVITPDNCSCAGGKVTNNSCNGNPMCMGDNDCLCDSCYCLNGTLTYDSCAEGSTAVCNGNNCVCTKVGLIPDPGPKPGPNPKPVQPVSPSPQNLDNKINIIGISVGVGIFSILLLFVIYEIYNSKKDDFSNSFI